MGKPSQHVPKPKAQPRNVSLYPSDWETIRRVARETGQRSISGGLRALIAEYTRLKRSGSGVSAPLPDNDEDVLKSEKFDGHGDN